jgi:hypothetical protein
MTTFLEGSAPALPKIFGTSGDVPSSITEKFLGASGDAPFRIFRRMNSALRKIRQIPCPLPLVPHWLKPVAWAEKSRKVCTPHSALRTISVHSCTLARILLKANMGDFRTFLPAVEEAPSRREQSNCLWRCATLPSRANSQTRRWRNPTSR